MRHTSGLIALAVGVVVVCVPLVVVAQTPQAVSRAVSAASGTIESFVQDDFDIDRFMRAHRPAAECEDAFDESSAALARAQYLLDMARLQAGSLQLNRQWTLLEETVGAALRACKRVLASHPVQVRLPADLPLLHLDAVLMERLFSNLFENAAKYTAPRFSMARRWWLKCSTRTSSSASVPTWKSSPCSPRWPSAPPS